MIPLTPPSEDRTVLTFAALSLLVSTAFGPAADSFQRLFDASGIVGMSVATVEDGAIASTHHFGVRDVTSGVPVDDVTVFEAASLTKPVVAYTALRLVDRGELDLDAPLLDVVAYDRLADDPLAPTITARMVLSHTSGLPNWGGTPLERNFEPGRAWGYSGEGYVLLGRVLEEISGRRLDDLVGRECFDPLGMTSSSLLWRDDYAETTATGHDLIGDPTDKRRPDTENAAASLHTTARDYAIFLAAALTGRGLSPDRFAEMQQPLGQVQGWGSKEAASHLQWGLGWGLQPTQAGGNALWHWGDNGAFRCFVWGDPATGRGLVYFTNNVVGHNVLEDMLALASDDTHWSARWLGYPRHDDPTQNARIAVRRTAVREGIDAAWNSIETFEGEAGQTIDDDEIYSLAEFLGDRGLEDRAIALLERMRGDRPSAQVDRALGVRRTSAGEFEAALTDLERAVATADSLREELEPRIAWLRETIDLRTAAPEPGDLAAYAGVYGPRVLELTDDTLYYSREGASRRTRLIPLGNGNFSLEGLPWFRLRIETDADGRGVAAIGLYADGRSDRTE